MHTGFEPSAEQNRNVAAARTDDEVRVARGLAGIIDGDDLRLYVLLHQGAKGLAILSAPAKDFNFFNCSEHAHHLQMAPSLPARTIESHNPTVVARQLFRSH